MGGLALISPMRLLLLAAAGAASLALVALRSKTSTVITRELALASLDREVGNWLPKLPFVRHIRVGTPGSDLLELTGDGSLVRLRLLRDVERGQDRRYAFLRTCAELGLLAVDAEGPGEAGPGCEVRAESKIVVHALERLLRDVFELNDTSRIVATIPSGD